MRHKFSLCLLLGIFYSSGCATLTVKQGDKEVGIQYYEPKPFVMVTYNANLSADDATSGNKFAMKVIYLPNLVDGPRSLRVNPNLGSADATLTLTEGWQLTSIETHLDSKFSDNVESLGGALAPLLTAGAGGGASPLLELAKEILPQLITASQPKSTTTPPPPHAQLWLFEVCVKNSRIAFEQVTGSPWKFQL